MKTIIITAFLFLINISVIAQNVKKNTYTTPDVASLAATVKTPVSLSSGSMNIEIPLYTLNEGDIEIPISMYYDATGIRVGSHPGWTGQNWTLKAGGMITRIIKGAPDEARVDWDYYNTQYGYQEHNKVYAPGYNWNHTGNSSSDWNSTSKITAFASLVNGIDLEPDEFIFNFMGHSGKFYLDHTGKYRTVGMENYKIEVAASHNIPLYDGTKPIWETIGNKTYINDDAYTYCNGAENQYFKMRQARIVGFKITDPYGYVYYFGQYERHGTGSINYYTDNFDGIEITSSFFEQIYDEVYSTWYLMKVISPKKRTATFTYENGYPVATFNRSYTMTNMRVQDQASFWNLWSPGYLATHREDSHMDGSLIRPQNLKSIETDNIKIDFTSSPSTALDYDYNLVQAYLNYIAINSYSPDILSAYMYGIWPVADIRVLREYSQHNPNRRPIFGRILYPSMLKWEKLNEIAISWKHGSVNPIKYVFSYRENANDRLQLTTIQKKVGAQVIPPYTFQYNNSKKLPTYFDLRTDHWGYYNANNNANNVTNKAAYKNYKDANENYIDSEILQKVTYPTGGTKEFIYEPNKYNKVVQRDASTGNLSIGTTTTEITGGGLRIKEIIEKPDVNSKSEHRIYSYSTGILNGEIQYYWPNYSGRLTNGNTYTSTRFFTHSVLPVSDNLAGGSVSYSTVTETIPENGKIVRTYSNHDTYLDDNADACIDPQKSAYSPLSSRAELRGKLLTETVYKENISQPISKTTYTYTPLNQNNYVRSVQTRGYVLFDGVTTNAIEGSSYRIYTDPVLVATNKEQAYPDNSSNPIETITSYVYNSNFDLDTQEVIGSNEGVPTKYKTVTKYVYNCDDADINTTSSFGYSFNRTTLTNRNMLKLPITITSYKNDVFDNKIHSRYAYKSDKNGVIYLSYVNKIFGNNKVSELFDLIVDNKGNCIQYSSIGNISTILIWGYNYQYLIAEIENSNLNDVQTTLGKTLNEIAVSPNPDIELINSLRTKLKDIKVTTYTYNPLVGLKTTTDPNGFVTYYNYDLMGRLSEIKDHNNNLIESYEYHYNQ